MAAPLRSLIVCTLLAACGGTDTTEPAPEPDPDPPITEPADPADQPLDGALELAGVSATGLNPRLLELRFTLTGAELAASAADFIVEVNGVPLDPSALTAAPHELRAQALLDDGRNAVALKVYDTIGRPLFLQRTLWAGDAALAIQLVDEAGSPFTAPATITLALADDPAITETRTTSSASATFANVPGRTVVIQARTLDNLVGVTGGVGTDGVMTIRMLGFDAPSAIANNDLALGLQGWSAGPSATVVGHVEAGAKTTAAAIDNDLQLVTSGQGEQTVSRTFATRPGTTSVSARFRFITSEVPGGYFGSEFNDYVSVDLRSQGGGDHQGEHLTMNGLGLAAFDAGGATQWRTITLATNPQGDVIQLDAAVANVADDQFDSTLVIDFVEERIDRVQPKLAWNSAQGGLTLTYTIEGTLETDVAIDVHWARDASFASRIGAPLFTHVVPAGASGSGGPIAIQGPVLAADPAGTTKLIAASSETKTAVLADVEVVIPGGAANPDLVGEAMRDVIRDALRAAGQPTATISSTARSVEDQARIMFENLTSTVNIAANIAAQNAIYAPAGEAVIAVFADLVEGLTRAEILELSAEIQTLMADAIREQGPFNVSHHCAESTELVVVDIDATVFTAANAPLFEAAATPRTSKFIDERKINKCFHLELPR